MYKSITLILFYKLIENEKDMKENLNFHLKYFNYFWVEKKKKQISSQPLKCWKGKKVITIFHFGLSGNFSKAKGISHPPIWSKKLLTWRVRHENKVFHFKFSILNRICCSPRVQTPTQLSKSQTDKKFCKTFITNFSLY